jgi:hypothetical protein
MALSLIAALLAQEPLQLRGQRLAGGDLGELALARHLLGRRTYAASSAFSVIVSLT